MKYLFLTIVFAFITLSSYAEPNKIANSIQKSVSEKIQYPAFAKDAGIEGIVILSYTINADNSISIIESNSNNAELKKYVINTLSSLKLENAYTNTNEIYYMRLNFRLL